jgi:hypothetical protein
MVHVYDSPSLSNSPYAKTIDQYKADFVELKKQIHEIEQIDVDDVKQANELLRSEIEKLKKALSEEIVRSHAGVRLDINLEKGRIRDEGMQLQGHLKNTDDRIEREIRTLRKHMEGIKLQILQYMIVILGTITGAGTLLLGMLKRILNNMTDAIPDFLSFRQLIGNSWSKSILTSLS